MRPRVDALAVQPKLCGAKSLAPRVDGPALRPRNSFAVLSRSGLKSLAAVRLFADYAVGGHLRCACYAVITEYHVTTALFSWDVVLNHMLCFSVRLVVTRGRELLPLLYCWKLFAIEVTRHAGMNPLAILCEVTRCRQFIRSIASEGVRCAG